MKIAFHDTHIGIRGTSVALYDYAYYNEEILKNKSIIIVPSIEKNSENDILGFEKFSKRFQIFIYNNHEELENILKKEKCDILYCIKYGKNDNIISKKIKTVIHCVFDMSDKHGDVYAGVSKTLAEKYNQNLYVPHMIGLKVQYENYREKLNISQNSIVFGRYGGLDTMNLDFCWRAIENILKNFDNIYFLFMNTPKKFEHEKIIYLPKTSKDIEKSKFIQTCDAYIECGSMGHTFGLSIGEFSIHNKPIIAYLGNKINYVDGTKNLWNNAHIEILGDRGIYFRDEKEFFHILTTFDPKKYEKMNLNCYEEYSPENVMEIFKKIFID